MSADDDKSRRFPNNSSQVQATPNTGVWQSFTSFILGNKTSKKKTGLDLQDVTYLLDMDGEGLCFHQFAKEEQAFKKQ